MLECPSQRETFRISLVACKIVIAHVCRNTCGETCLAESEGQRFSALRTCLHRMYSNPERVIGSLRALRNNSRAWTLPLTASQARKAEAVSFHRGRQRSFRPLPWTRTLACGCKVKSSRRRPISSETRNPPAKQR